MKRAVIVYLKHLLVTILVAILGIIAVVLFLNGSLHYGDLPEKKVWKNEGPYIFYENDSISIHHISGNKEHGFYYDKVNQHIFSQDSVTCHFSLDNTSFAFDIKPSPATPFCDYRDEERILVISDIESGYRTFRDFLINNGVINSNAEWTFGRGHLVLLGDFVDRGNSTMQVLWLIYKLEQEAKGHGGYVHFILGNHEIKNLQGNYTKASMKYFYASSIIKKKQYELYNSTSVLGEWLLSKNTVERINGFLFVHGGIHPEVLDYSATLLEINDLIRKNYQYAYYPKGKNNLENTLLSTTSGPAWYRGYFSDDVSEEDISDILKYFEAKSIIVGHTLQRKVKKLYEGKVIAVDVHHPKDYRKSLPKRRSEGLLIKNGKFYRVFYDGRTKEL